MKLDHLPSLASFSLWTSNIYRLTIRFITRCNSHGEKNELNLYLLEKAFLLSHTEL